MTGGTENIASTKMKKQLGVSNTHDDADPETCGGSQSGVPSTDQTSEGRKKALDAMFDNMAPVLKSSSKSKRKKRGDDDSSDDDKPKRRREEKDDPKVSPEAGFT